MNIQQLIQSLITEQPNERTKQIDQLPTEQILTLINDEDRLIADAVRGLIPQLTQAVDRIVESFRKGGRLFYIGAGTSGRIGILDASECPHLRHAAVHGAGDHRRRVPGDQGSG